MRGGSSAALALVLLFAAACTGSQKPDPVESTAPEVDVCAQFDGDFAFELTGVREGEPNEPDGRVCHWRSSGQGGGKERGNLSLSVLPPVTPGGRDVFERAVGEGCGQAVEVEAVRSCWHEVENGFRVVVELDDMVVEAAWFSWGWEKKTREQKSGLVNRTARAAVKGL